MASPSVSEMDTVAYSRLKEDRRAFDILMQANQYWNNMSVFRKERERNKNYNYGKQWSDIVTVDGETMTEEEYITSQGNIPLKNNLIRRLVRNVLGVFRSQTKEPTCVARDRDEQKLGETMSIILQCNWQLNRMNEINARTMEEFLISGMIVHKKTFGWRNDKLDCWTDYIQPDNFFVDGNMRDFRGWDVSMLGEVHDVSFEALCREFAKSPEDYTYLRRIYSYSRSKDYLATNCEKFGQKKLSNLDFLFAAEPGLCRVIEVWNKEMKPRYRCHDYNTGDVYKIEEEDYAEMVLAENEDRLRTAHELGVPKDDVALIKAEWFMDTYWYYRFLTPTGDVLDEGETPYDHKSHPYVFKIYPFIDGEVHSFVSDVIDQQRYVNRLITLYDWIMRASAKGLLLFPEECLPDGMDINDIADEWSRFNGVLLIKTKTGAPIPQQISNNSTNIGISELLNVQLKFFEDISGVSGALQGKPGYSGMSGSLYAQQTMNSTTSLLDLLDSFSSFVIDGAYKDVKNMQQYYDTRRVFNIAGRACHKVLYDPVKVRDTEFDLSIVESTTTPAYRQAANDFLLQIWQSGQISLEQLLENGEFPFADSLLQNIKAQREQVANGEVPQGLSPQLMAQAQQGADMKAVNQLHQAMMG